MALVFSCLEFGMESFCSRVQSAGGARLLFVEMQCSARKLTQTHSKIQTHVCARKQDRTRHLPIPWNSKLLCSRWNDMQRFLCLAHRILSFTVLAKPSARPSCQTTKRSMCCRSRGLILRTSSRPSSIPLFLLVSKLTLRSFLWQAKKCMQVCLRHHLQLHNTTTWR